MPQGVHPLRNLFLSILTQIYKWIIRIRNFAYDYHLIKKVHVNCPVISIGNITVGGTGKTPVTSLVLNYLLNQNLRVALISRSYKAEATEPVKVDIHKKGGAQFFGDEAYMLAQQNPGVDVFVGQIKNRIAQFATQIDRYDVLVVDDGFQHRKLHRELDLVLLDVTDPIEKYNLIPSGKGRENLKSLNRADLVLLTKINLIDEDKISDLQKIIPIDKATCCLSYNLSEIRWVDFLSGKQFEKQMESQFQNSQEFRPLVNDSIFLIAGVAKPEIFLKMVRQKFNKNEVHLIPFPDHHHYDLNDIQLIKRRAQSSPWLLTTHKDLVKLRDIWPQDIHLWVADLSVQIESGKELFYEKINNCLS